MRHTILLCGVLFSMCPINSYANAVYTACGNYVGHIHNSPDWTTAEKTYIKALEDFYFPDATRLQDPTVNFNCHSYAFASSSEWIDDHVDEYLDSYQPDYLGGNRLCYTDCLSLIPSHSAIDLDEPGYTAQSKWGSGSLMEHDWDYGPYGDPDFYYDQATCNSGGIKYMDYCGQERSERDEQ